MKQYTVMIKPASALCNLRCKYCFYFDVVSHRDNHALKMMTEETTDRILCSLRNSLEPGDELTIAFQGGEPMLMGLAYYRSFVEQIAKWDKKIHIKYAIQTNATLIDEEWCVFFKENEFLVGVSYDLLPDRHNEARIDSSGKGTGRVVEHSIAMLRRHGVEFNVLCTLTNGVARHPQQAWKRILQLDLAYTQFTPCLNELDQSSKTIYGLTPKRFADFYNTLFLLWFEEYRLGRYRSIKFFDDVLNLMAFGIPSACGMDGACQPQIVVEADGSAYPCDFYCLDEYKTGNLCNQTIAEIIDNPTVKHFVERNHEQPELCKSCELHAFCGGGCKRMQAEICCAKNDSYCGYADFLKTNWAVLKSIALRERRARGYGGLSGPHGFSDGVEAHGKHHA